MTIATGVRLGPHEILAAIGAAGMGEVYRARNMKLGRAVALKLLTRSLTILNGLPNSVAKPNFSPP
jgi:eukaryotic-like serine/threonine-protein kinase